MMYFMYYSLCYMDFAKKNKQTLKHIVEESQVLSYNGLLILRLKRVSSGTLLKVAIAR